MGFEIEIKFRVADHDDLRRRLEARGAEPEATVDHEDTYLAHPSRDFAGTGEAFRIRGEGMLNRITYKGPKLGGPAKTREEIEVAFAEGLEARGELGRTFELLGFRPVAVVRKSRTEYHLESNGRAVAVSLDLAEGLGAFAEVETLAGSEAELPKAQRAVVELAEELGLREVEPRSYLRMLLESRGLIGRNPPGQT
ncbi:class IV adenylate cyclase [Tundrisphaera lichenicola]|uniref:class IV adenylate cyclase n=1 Tax=Tundrisphaera lichenicola TaxID=2029860 RepID=UPI003EB7A01D